MLAVVAAVTDEQKRSLAAELEIVGRRCPTRGLELVVYTEDGARAADRDVLFALNLNTGPGMPFHASFDPAEEPRHWFVVDLAIARVQAIALRGLPASDVFPPIPEERILDALAASLRWHADEEPAGPSTVLNACRAWRFVTDGVWSSKSEAGRWAQARSADAALIAAALAGRRGEETGELDVDAVGGFLADVLQLVDEASISRSRRRATRG